MSFCDNFRGIFKALVIMLFFITGLVAQAEDLSLIDSVVFDGNMIGRTSLDFRVNSKNRKGYISQGTKASVLEARKLSLTGSYGVKIKITELPSDATANGMKVGDEMWVYYSERDPQLTFKDKNSQNLDDPETDLLFLAVHGSELNSVGVVNKPGLPTRTQILKDMQPTPTTCVCTQMAANDASGVAEQNVQNLKQISAQITSTTPVTTTTTTEASQIWAQDPWISKYEKSDKVQELIRVARNKSLGYSKKKCYRYVKQDLVASGMVDDYPNGRYAKGAVNDLQEEGMVNLLDNPKYKSIIGQDPSKAPKGSVIVYSTGEKHEAGHIEIKTGHGDETEYISDYHSTQNIQESRKGQYKERIGKPYEIIGVMVLPEAKL